MPSVRRGYQLAVEGDPANWWRRLSSYLRSIYPNSKNDPDVGRLLGILGHLPFAVTLMARLGKEGQLTAKELILAWSKNGPDILPDHHEQNMNRSIGLSVDSNLMKQNPQARLLNILSFLPAGPTKATLRWWVPALDSSMVPSAIATLFKTGLFVRILPSIFENWRQDSDFLSCLCSPSSSHLCNSMAG